MIRRGIAQGSKSSWMRKITSFCVAMCLFIILPNMGYAASPAEEAQLVDELIAGLSEIYARSQAPSIQVAVVRDGEIAWSNAFGEGTSTDHAYMNASVQKTITAIAVLQLVEQGRVELTGDINDYLPFSVRHPEYPDEPITVRMLLSHRSGLDYLPYIFEWDTESTFSPHYRRSAPTSVLAMSLEEFLAASLVPGGSNYNPQSWVRRPGKGYHYSVSAYPLLRCMVGEVTGQSYADYVRSNIFAPLSMTNSGFTATEFSGHHAIPYTREGDRNIALPLYDGNGFMMHTTAEDLAKVLIALMQADEAEGFQVIQPETAELMRKRTSRFKTLFKTGDDLVSSGYGLGMQAFQVGWYGHGGSAPGYQCLMRFHPGRQVGYVIMMNVNAILSGGDNYETVRSEIYAVQDALIGVLDPSYAIRRLGVQASVVAGIAVASLGLLGLRMLLKR